MIGLVLWWTGKPARRCPSSARRWRSSQKLADENPAVAEFRRDLATSHMYLGNVLSLTGKPAEAEAELRTALAIYRELADENPAVTAFRSNLAVCRLSRPRSAC